MDKLSYRRHRFPSIIIQYAVWLYFRFGLSYRDVEDMLAERGIDVTYETVRRWVLKFGTTIARRLRRGRPRSSGRWHLDEVFVSINSRQLYVWCAVDSEGEVLDVLVQPRRDRKAALKLMRKLLIVQEKVFEDTGGARRTDSGIVQVQRQMPGFTQSAPAYDVLIAADESEVFAGYLPYRTWDPRPVVGSAGLVPKSWDASHDQWGANQLQNRFMAMFSRRMSTLDGQSWTAARMIGEAATRTRASDAKSMLAFLKGPDFALAGFKGQRLTLRDWNLQLRQPILLSDGKVIVSVSPQEGFLHQTSELDTLGYDRPETKCKLK
jgi:DDE domain